MAAKRKEEREPCEGQGKRDFKGDRDNTVLRSGLPFPSCGGGVEPCSLVKATHDGSFPKRYRWESAY